MKRKLIAIALVAIASFAFVACNNGTEITTGSTTTTTTNGSTTTTTTTTETPFDRTLLVNYLTEEMTVDEIAPSSTEVEEKIDYYQALFGDVDERMVYELLTGVDTLESTFMDSIDTLADLQAWYQGAIDLGINENIVAATAVNMLIEYIQDQIDAFDVSELTAAIVDMQADISESETAMTDLDAAVAAYINAYISPEYQDAALLYYEGYRDSLTDLKTYNELESYYSDELYDDEWNASTYYNLSNFMFYYYYYLYVQIDETSANNYMTDYNNYYNQLSTSEQAMYAPVLDSYQAYLTDFYTNYYGSMHILSGIADSNMQEINSYMYNTFLTPYVTAYYNMRNLMGQLDDMNDELAQENHIIDFAGDVRTYLMTTEGRANAVILVTTLYDLLDYVVTNFNSDTYDLIMEVVNEDISSFPFLSEGDYGIEFDPSLLTPTHIATYAAMIAGIFSNLTATLDTNDLSNIETIATDVMTIFFEDFEYSTEDTATYMAFVEDIFHNYVPALLEDFADLGSLFGTIDATVASDIYNAFILIYNEDGETSDEVIAITVAKAIDDLLGGSEPVFDLAGAICDVFDLYYTMYNTFEPDDHINLIEVNSDINYMVSEMLSYAASVASYDVNNLTVQQQDEIDYFISCVGNFVSFMSQGFGYYFDN